MAMPAGMGQRCWGFLSSDGTYAHCSREELANGLAREEAGTYAHYLGDGSCKCGTAHTQTGNVSFQTPPVRKESKNGHRRALNIVQHRRWKVSEDPDTGAPIEHVRLDFDDGSKRIWWERGGKKGLGGIDPATLPLYGKRHAGSKHVIIVEGEKCADALNGFMDADDHTDYLAVTLGAPKIPKDDALKELNLYDTVYLWPDNDDVGQELMRGLGERLVLMGRSRDTIRIQEWQGPERPKGADAADYVEHSTAWEKEGVTLKFVSFQTPFSPGTKETPRHKLFTTAADIAAAVEETIPWLVEPWLVRGAITELSGKIKSAGKTTFASFMVASLLDGKPFMMKATMTCPVVYLTEQNPRSLRETLSRAGLLTRTDDFSLLLYRDVVGMSWPDVCTLARDEARRIGAGLVVVDTLPQFSGTRDENDSTEALKAMEPLQRLAGTDDLAVLSMRHDRKSAGDVGDSARGSSAYAGVVDIVLRIRRGEGKTRETIRIIDGLSRFDETPDSFVTELTNNGYEPRGTVADVSYQEAKTAIWRSCPTSEGDAIDRKELCSLAEVSGTTGHRAIEYYVEQGIIRRLGEGRRGDPYLYWRPDFRPTDS